jgi:hypothetical protein
MKEKIMCELNKEFAEYSQSVYYKLSARCRSDEERQELEYGMARHAGQCELYHLRCMSPLMILSVGWRNLGYWIRYTTPAQAYIDKDKTYSINNAINELCSLYKNNPDILDKNDVKLVGVETMVRDGACDFSGLSYFNNLTALNLTGLKINSRDIESLIGLALGTLHLDNTQIDDNCIQDLGLMTSLGTVGVEGTKITKEGLARLRELLPECVVWNG